MAWIEGKLEQHGVTKVIPAEDILIDAYRRARTQSRVQARIDEVLEEMGEVDDDEDAPPDLRERIDQRLRESPDAAWDEVVREIAVDDEADEV